MSEGRKRLTRQESQLVTRGRLIAAAKDLIVREGISAASVRNVAEVAGYSQGAFYSNFPTRQHLLMAVMTDHLDGVATRVEAMVDEILLSPGPADLRETPAALIAFLRNLNPKSNWSTLAVELQLNANRSADLATEYSALQEGFFGRLGAAFRRLFDHLGLTPAISPEELAMGLISTSVGFSIQFGETPALEARGRFMAAIFGGILKTASPRREG